MNNREALAVLGSGWLDGGDVKLHGNEPSSFSNVKGRPGRLCGNKGVEREIKLEEVAVVQITDNLYVLAPTPCDYTNGESTYSIPRSRNAIGILLIQTL